MRGDPLSSLRSALIQRGRNGRAVAGVPYGAPYPFSRGPFLTSLPLSALSLLALLSPPGEETVRLQCGHTYHADCLLRWLARSGSCPLCKLDVAGSQGTAAAAWEEEPGRGRRRGGDGDAMFGLATLLLVAGLLLADPSRLAAISPPT